MRWTMIPMPESGRQQQVDQPPLALMLGATRMSLEMSARAAAGASSAAAAAASASEVLHLIGRH